MNVRNLSVCCMVMMLMGCATSSNPSKKINRVAQVCDIPLPINPTTFKGISVFGVPLGEKLELPECSKESYGYSIGAQHICFERLWGKESNLTLVCDESIEIKFPTLSVPLIMSGTVMMATTIDGRIESVGFNTYGYSSQKKVLSELIKKYGQPTTYVPRKVKNGLGVTFETFMAAWSLNNTEVLFHPILGKVNAGLVNISTEKGAKSKTEKLNRILKDPRPL